MYQDTKMQQEIAQELHDSIAQSLAATSLMLQTLLTQSAFPVDDTRAMLQRAHMTIRTANAELRTLIDRIRPTPTQAMSIATTSHEKSHRAIKQSSMTQITGNAPVTHQSATASLSAASQKLVAIDRIRRIGLIASLREYFGHALLHHVQFQFNASQYLAQELASEVELFRVVQEAVSNAIRHGKATKISVALCCQHQQVQLRVINNGIAIAPTEAERSQVAGVGVGIASMRMRMQRLSGQLSVENSDSGVTVSALLPSRPLTPATKSA